MHNDATVRLATELIGKRSVTPEDAGCQALIEKRLVAAGFKCEYLSFGDVTNMWARCGTASPVLCFAGHTDVVPPGDVSKWHTDPFSAEIRDGFLCGRGAADMKGGLAAMITAAERFVATGYPFTGSLAFLITSDEEGVAENGTRKVIDALRSRQEKIDFCVVGEPSSNKIPGDVLRIGRRGSLTGYLTVNGTEGHVAYGHLASNPIRHFAPALAELHDIEWDKGNEHFPPTTFEVAHVLSSSGTDNVIPGLLSATFNLRYSTQWCDEDLRKKIESVLDAHNLDYTLNWHLSGEPFLTPHGAFTDSVVRSVREVAGVETSFSTGGGTSDGRFISPFGADVIEVGLTNSTIHKINERVDVAHLPLVSKIYERIMQLVLAAA
ncbi:MAG: succinyl-diaminopimelate desuccinylase [Woeseiaceae bacterium]